MADQATIQLEKYYQKILSQEGLGIYRANPWERNRPFNPEELERLVLPEKMKRLDIIFPCRSSPNENKKLSSAFSTIRFRNEKCQKTQSSRSSVRTYRPSLEEIEEEN